MEQLDILDCRGMRTGDTISREEAHRSGAWHGAFHCLILSRREGRGFALFQKRSAAKEIAPGRFDVSVGGHYGAGEAALSAGPREIKEELGIDVCFEDLLPVGRRVFVYCFEPGVRECEFQDVFLLPRDLGRDEITLQAEEVDGLLELEVDAGIRLFSREVPNVEGRFFDSTTDVVRRKVFAGEFVPCLDNYYLKMLLLARRYFLGERVLVI